MKSGSSARLRAMKVLLRVVKKKERADMAMAELTRGLPDREQRLLHELVYGVLRHWFSLEADYSRFSRKRPDDACQVLLMLGTYQLRHMRVPAHAAVSETVALADGSARGFVNAILRRVSESPPPERFKPWQRAELPKWMYAAWKEHFGAEVVQEFCQWFRQPPPLSLAVLGDRDEWITRARAAGFEAKRGQLSPYAVLLPCGTPVQRLPGYAEGRFLVMDQAAQTAALGLDAPDAGLIFDLCAAPGGKTALLHHTHVHARLIAVERQGKRLALLQQNMERLAPEISLLQADALCLPFQQGQADAVFLDAPCTASGVLRRHPDAKFLHVQADVKRMADQQRKMLLEALRVLRPGGRLLYAVCSIHRQENEDVIDGVGRLLVTRRVLPCAEADGFFMALIEKP